MNPIETRPLPNAADKVALKAIATQVINACPSLQDTAHEVASQLLVKYGVTGLDPDKVYFHRFKTAQHLESSFTGWQHYDEKPYESQTLTQLVIHRFRATDQDNADLLGLYGGFYTAGPDETTFDATNEVRLQGSDVLRDFWNINISELYRNKLNTFWSDHAADFRTLAKCNFLSKAVEARDSGHLTDEDFQTTISAVIGPLTWPVNLAMLKAESTVGQGLHVYTLDVADYLTTNILRIVDAKGRQILYVPGDSEAFHVLETSTDMHWWILQQMNEKAPRAQFLEHFPLSERQQITENITDLMNRLVSTWGHSDHHLINQKNQAITADAFTWLRDSTRTAMLAEADLSLTSNGDLRKKLWIGYLSASLKVFGPMAVVGWPVALPVIGASLANMGLNIDQAVNGKTAAERKEGVIAAVLSGIDALFNLPFLKDAGSLAEIDTPLEAVEAGELSESSPAPELEGEESNAILPSPEELPPMPSETGQVSEIPQTYQSNELLDGLTPDSEPGKYKGIYRLDSDPPYAIVMNDTAYYVRYFADSQGGGFWAIVDPARPNQLIHSMPVRLNAEGSWERMTQLGLKGGGLCLGKPCTVDVQLDALEPTPNEPEQPPGIPETPPTPEPEPSTSADIGLVRTPYDVDTARQAELKKWAMGLRETHVRVEIGPNGQLTTPDRYALHFTQKARTLLLSARRFYRNLPWGNLPPRPEIPAVDARTTLSELITRVFEAAPGLVISETPGRITSMRFMIENMEALARQGVKTLYVRRLLSDFAQVELNTYFKTGDMSKDLEDYLSRLGTDPSGRFNELQLVKTARQNGIRVQATDCAATYRKPESNFHFEEQMMANHLTADIMFMDKSINNAGKWVVLTELGNTNTFRGLAGISELEGGIGLRIEEVSPGEAESVTVDPGMDMERGPIPEPGTLRGRIEPLHADLLLHMKAPPVSRNELQIHTLLYRTGMYVFERIEGTLTLFHRSHGGDIVQTPVQVFADGRYYLDRPSWGPIHRVAYDNLEQLSGALDRIGMKLQSRLPA